MQVLTIIVANIGVTISLFLWCRHESGEDRKQFLTIMLELKDEMKDFHGRLEKLDAEFKAHIIGHKNDHKR